MEKEKSFENKIIAIIESKVLETIASNVGWHTSSGIQNSGFYRETIKRT